MISDAAGHEHLVWTWFLLTAASAGVFLHAGIKFPWFVFFQKDSGLRPPDPPWHMQAAMIFFAVLCVGIGVLPGPLYALLPYPVDYVPYTAAHVVNMLQLLMFSALAFFLLLPLMKRTLTITLDFDWFYRRAGGIVASQGMAITRHLGARLSRTVGRGLTGAADVARKWYGEDSRLGGVQTVGSTIVIVLIVFALMLIWDLLRTI